METITFATVLFIAYFCLGCCLLYNPSSSTPADCSAHVPLVAAANLTVTSQAQPVALLTESATTLDKKLEEDAIEEPTAAIDRQAVATLLTPETPITSQRSKPAQVTMEDCARVVEETPESLLEPIIEELLQDIELDTLQLRPARKICGKLGIQQKVNGKDAPLSWLRAQIKSRLTEKPQETAPVIMSVLKAS